MSTARQTAANIKRGDVVIADYKTFCTPCRFLGFFTDHLGTGLGFASLAELKCNVADKECWYAMFQDCAERDERAAYWWNGRWRVGSSADTLKLTQVEACREIS